MENIREKDWRNWQTNECEMQADTAVSLIVNVIVIMSSYILIHLISPNFFMYIDMNKT